MLRQQSRRWAASVADPGEAGWPPGSPEPGLPVRQPQPPERWRPGSPARGMPTQQPRLAGTGRRRRSAVQRGWGCRPSSAAPGLAARQPSKRVASPCGRPSVDCPMGSLTHRGSALLRWSAGIWTGDGRPGARKLQLVLASPEPACKRASRAHPKQLGLPWTLHLGHLEVLAGSAGVNGDQASHRFGACPTARRVVDTSSSWCSKKMLGGSARSTRGALAQPCQA